MAQFDASYQAQDEQLYNVMKSQAVQGILPIRVDIPMVGRAIRFSKLLVTTESPSVELGYVHNAKKAGWLLTLLVFGLILWLGQRLERRIMRTEPLSTGDAVLALVATAVMIASVWLGHVSIALVLLALFIVATTLWIARLRHWLRKRRQSPEA